MRDMNRLSTVRLSLLQCLGVRKSLLVTEPESESSDSSLIHPRGLRHIITSPLHFLQHTMSTIPDSTENKLVVARQKKTTGDAAFKAGNWSDGV
jgi:hypothetical protein